MSEDSGRVASPNRLSSQAIEPPSTGSLDPAGFDPARDNASSIPIEERFADRLRRLRAFRGLSLQQVAVAAGCVKPHVWELERGRSANPSVKLTENIARVLGADPSWLAGWGGVDPFMPSEPEGPNHD